jgi:hypothetical protein
MLQTKVGRLQSELRGLPVMRAYRSLGSMIHFDFGALGQWHERTGERTRHGTYGLMIELADWVITQRGACLATDQSWNRRIDRAVAMFLGARIKRVNIGPKVLAVTFDKDLELIARPIGAGHGALSPLENWTIFRGEKAALGLTRKGQWTSS